MSGRTLPYWMAAIVLALGLSATVGISTLLRQAENKRIEAVFTDNARQRTASIQSGIEARMDTVKDIGALHAASEIVERSEFALFTSTELARVRGIEALEWIPRVPESERGRYLDEAERDGLAGFEIKQRDANGRLVVATGRDEYYPIYFVEPLNGNELVLGFDLASDRTRNAALIRARETGELATTDPITLIQDNDRRVGVLSFFPIYHNGSDTETVEARIANLKGFGLGVFQIEDMIDGILQQQGLLSDDPLLNLYLEDLSDPGGPIALYGNAGDETSDHDASLSFDQTFTVGGQVWRASITPLDSFYSEHSASTSWFPLAAGSLLTLLTSAFVFTIGRRSDTVQRLVAVRTAQLTEANEQLSNQIVEREKSERALIESEASKETLLRAIPDLMFRMDSDGTFLDFRGSTDDPDLAAIPENFIGKKVTDMMPKVFADLALENVRETISTGEPHTFEYKMPVPVGSDNLLDYEARVHLSGPGEALILVRNITERRALERMKDEFISTVSHELRTPLTSIRGALGLLDGPLLPDAGEQVRSLLKIGINNTDRLVRLINEILDLERLQAGEEELIMEPVSVGSVVREALDGLQVVASNKDVKLVMDVEDSTVEADKDKIVQVLTNLASNAVKFSEPGMTVSVKARPITGGTQVSVIDTGRGIPAEKLESVFGRFQQVDASDSRRNGGTGLGLAICKSIVELHGGRIWVESEFGSGSAFNFELPERQSVDATVDQPFKAVLIVEDDTSLAQVLQQSLRLRGITASVATNAAEGISLYMTNPCQALIVDIALPGPSGLEMLDRLRPTFTEKNSRAIIYSAKEATREEIAKLQPLQCEVMLKSKISIEEIVNRVERLLLDAEQSENAA